MDPWSLVGGGVIGGLGALFNAGKKRKQARLQAETTMYSPWTGLKGEAPEETNAFGDVTQGLAQGLAFGQNMANQKSASEWDDLRKKYMTKLIDRDDPPYIAPGF
jgi:gas vesicle protein